MGETTEENYGRRIREKDHGRDTIFSFTAKLVSDKQMLRLLRAPLISTIILLCEGFIYPPSNACPSKPPLLAEQPMQPQFQAQPWQMQISYCLTP